MSYQPVAEEMMVSRNDGLRGKTSESHDQTHQVRRSHGLSSNHKQASQNSLMTAITMKTFTSQTGAK